MATSPPKPGDETTRAEMQDVFGGGPQGGIVPSRKTPSVLLYTDPKVGERSGYVDGWLAEDDEGLFEYTGKGEEDQTFTDRNKAILNHAVDNRALHVFKAVGLVPGTGTKRQRYIGEFELDADLPYVLRQTPNKAGVVRRVIVFRLRPVGGRYERLAEDVIPPAEKTEAVTIPADATESKIVESEINKTSQSSRKAVPETIARRREAKLSDDFQALLESKQHEVKRFEIRIKGLSSPLKTDLYDETDRVLYEAKATNSREAIRMAIGQLLDYTRHVVPVDPQLAVLLPAKPSEDLQELLASTKIALVYREGEDFIGWPVTG